MRNHPSATALRFAALYYDTCYSQNNSICAVSLDRGFVPLPGKLWNYLKKQPRCFSSCFSFHLASKLWSSLCYIGAMTELHSSTKPYQNCLRMM